MPLIRFLTTLLADGSTTSTCDFPKDNSTSTSMSYVALWPIPSDRPEISSVEDNRPVLFSQAEIEECLKRDAKQKTADEQMQQVRNFIGINIEGWVMNEEFESAKEKAKLIRCEMAEAADTDAERKEFEENWPFQDHEEID